MIYHLATRRRIAPREMGYDRDDEQAPVPTLAALLHAEALAAKHGDKRRADAYRHRIDARLRKAQREARQ